MAATFLYLLWLFGAACTPRQYFCALLGTNKIVVVVDDALVKVEL